MSETSHEPNLDQLYIRTSLLALEIRDKTYEVAKTFEEIAHLVPVTHPEGIAARRLALVSAQEVGYDDYTDQLAAGFLADPQIPPDFAAEITGMFTEGYTFPGAGANLT